MWDFIRLLLYLFLAYLAVCLVLIVAAGGLVLSVRILEILLIPLKLVARGLDRMFHLLPEEAQVTTSRRWTAFRVWLNAPLFPSLAKRSTRDPASEIDRK